MEVRYTLRFISGKYVGGEYPLRRQRRILIGRTSEADMVLVDDRVSRKHAEINTFGDRPVMTDLQSRNGTFINGDRVGRATLTLGDRIVIGSAILKVIDGSDDLSEEEAKAQLEMTVASPRALTGELAEIPLPDVLRLLSSSRRSGNLEVHGAEGNGQILFHEGRVYTCSVESAKHAPQAALEQMLRWKTGAFRLEPPTENPVPDELSESVEKLIQEALHRS